MQTEKNGHTILVGDDELEVREYLEIALKCMGYAVELAQDGEEVISYLRSPGRPAISAVVLDLIMPRRDGMDVLREIRQMDPELPVIVVSGAASPLNVVTVVAAMKNGATDFLCKPASHEDLQEVIRRALENRYPAQPAPLVLTSAKTKVFVGANPRMKEIQALVAHVGRSETPVLIQGETGSGKEVLARELHSHSSRANKLFLKLNCAALPSELVESELFGYERGAFTGAFQRKAGMFEAADGGTIFLDEIGDMDVRLQAKLLQVLQDHEFQRIGGKDVIKVDVRVMAATHRDLEKAMAERTFREDLYYRLNVINIHLPALRERKEDIVPLAEYLLRKHAVAGRTLSLTAELKSAMMAYHWPGNVRELENVVRKLIVLNSPDLVARELRAKVLHRPALVLAAGAGSSKALEPEPAPAKASGNTPILEQLTKATQQAEREAVLAVLESTHWNRKQAAALLNIEYKALLYKMKKLAVHSTTGGFYGRPRCDVIWPN